MTVMVSPHEILIGLMWNTYTCLSCVYMASLQDIKNKLKSSSTDCSVN